MTLRLKAPRYLGWIAAASLVLSASGWTAPALFGVSPDNSQELVVRTIRSAKQSLQINIYEFEHPGIRDAVLAAIQRGIKVQILVEGEPVGGLSRTGHQLLKDLLKAMEAPTAHRECSLHLMVKPVSPGQTRRFAYNHAKYLVVDLRDVLVSSENFSFGAHPNSGQVGNRGWHAVIQDRALANRMLGLFEQDADPRLGDALDLRREALPESGRRTDNSHAPATRSLKPMQITRGEVDSVQLVTSPHSLNGLIEFIRGAKVSIDLEFMSLAPYWPAPLAGLPKPVNPIVEELEAAAKRGVRVRVLLNDEAVFAQAPNPPPGSQPKGLLQAPTKRSRNLDTVCRLQGLAKSAKLAIEGRIVNVKRAQITYIHNKGMVVDGNKAWVSSINGTQNSVQNNREVALAIHSADAAKYFDLAFRTDWTASQSPSASDCQVTSPTP